MPRKIPPADSDLLCESCGYIITGLPETAACPECGTPIEFSLPRQREPNQFDVAASVASRTRQFVPTAFRIVFTPDDFYRSMSVRSPGHSDAFAFRVRLINALLFAVAAVAHLVYLQQSNVLPGRFSPIERLAMFAAFFIVINAGLYALYRLASKLTSFEGTYRGLRLPLRVVRRVMNFHQATLILPAAIATAVTIVPHYFRYAAWYSDERYLYTLSGVVVLGAVYLFTSYWGAMRRVMYANA